MGRPHNEKSDEAYKLFKRNMPLVEIAEELGVPAATVRRWKLVYKWDGTNSERSENSARSENIERAECKVSVVVKLDAAPLNDNQKLFCLYYVKYFNGAKAYKKVYGCSDYTARTNASRALADPKIRKEIDALKYERMNRACLEPEDIFQRYMDIAFSDITDYVEFGREEIPVMGAFGPIVIKNPKTQEETPLTKEVNSVRFKESSEVDGSLISEVKQGRDGASVKLQDRMKALDWLAAHLPMATELQQAQIAALRAKTQTAPSDVEREDDGFLAALEGKAAEVWGDSDDEE